MAGAILERILAAGTVEDEHGNVLPLRDNISAHEGQRISACIGRYGIERTLEVGCAYGISSLYICDAISKQPHPHHVIIDPAQSTGWHNVGVQNLRRARFTFWELIEQPSALALPSLLGRGLKVQFALIDGWHTFDQVLLDFFYVDQLLEDGGIVAFDDVDKTPINRVVRYVSNYPNYSIVESVNDSPLPKFSLKHRLFDFFLRRLTNAVPSRVREEYFTASCLRPCENLRSGVNMVFVQKSGPDTRTWDWYKSF
jgi:predicted O-methyltransferase YrrM